MSGNRVYFPNLNAIRFLAALVVIIHHVEMTKHWFGLPNIYKNSFVGGVLGQVGIILFFVLSGFLITYLLLEEHKRSGTIAIKGFYMRRVLRIWPLYYLITILGLYILPNIPFFDTPGFTEFVNDDLAAKSALYLTFFSNIAYTIYEHVPYSAQTWSVGVEEQFYLIWPLLMLFAINRKKIMSMLLSLIGIYLAVKAVVVYQYAIDMNNIAAMKRWLYWNHFSIDCMAIGGIAAYLLFFKKERILKVLFNSYLQIALYGILTVVILRGWTVPWFNKEFYAIIFAVLILNLSANPKTILNLEYKPLNYLGKISYGLYMYHNIMIVLVMKLMIMSGLFNVGSLVGSVLLQVLTLVATIGVSAFSYEYFEKWFLRRKTKYTTVHSGQKEPEPQKKEATGRISIPVSPQTA